MSEAQPKTTLSRNTADISEAVGLAIQRARDHLLSIQYPEGYWWGELETNVCMAAERWIVGHQEADGSWGWHPAAVGLLPHGSGALSGAFDREPLMV